MVEIVGRPVLRSLLSAMVVAVLVLTVLGGTGRGQEGSTRTARAAALALASTPQTVRLKVVKAHNGATLALAPVFIRGKGPFVFAVDTGASQSVVDSSLVKRLHLQQGRSERVTGIACTSMVREVKVQHWSVERVDLPARTITSTNLPGKGSSGLQGLLGSDILSQFGAFRLDYTHQVLVLHAR